VESLSIRKRLLTKFKQTNLQSIVNLQNTPKEVQDEYNDEWIMTNRIKNSIPAGTYKVFIGKNQAGFHAFLVFVKKDDNKIRFRFEEANNAGPILEANGETVYAWEKVTVVEERVVYSEGSLIEIMEVDEKWINNVSTVIDNYSKTVNCVSLTFELLARLKHDLVLAQNIKTLAKNVFTKAKESFPDVIPQLLNDTDDNLVTLAMRNAGLN